MVMRIWRSRQTRNVVTATRSQHSGQLKREKRRSNSEGKFDLVRGFSSTQFLSRFHITGRTGVLGRGKKLKSFGGASYCV